MSETLLRRAIREELLNEGLLGMIVAYKTAKWLMTDSMDEVEDGYSELQSVAEDLQGSVEDAIEDIEDRAIKDMIVKAGSDAVEVIQSAINEQNAALKESLMSEVEGAEELDMDEDDVNAMVSLAMSASIAKVIATCASE